MRDAMLVDMAQQFGSALRGKLPGKRDFARLCELLCVAPPATAVYFDFADVDLLAASWLNAAFVPFVRWAADERNDLYPLVHNAHPVVLEEFALVADWTHSCFLAVEGPVPSKRATLIGSLDFAQRATLNAVLDLAEATGAELERQKPEERIGATAWNNRLKDLYGKRLLRRERRGRERVYTPVMDQFVLDLALVGA